MELFKLKKGAAMLLLSLFSLLLNSQSCVWAKSPTGNGAAQYVATDPSGNVYITGFFQGPTITFGTYTLNNTGSQNVFLAKYDPFGNVLWARCGAGDGITWAYAVTTDKLGNVIISGCFTSSLIAFGNYTFSSKGAEDFYIVKYDSNGNVLWARSGGEENTENVSSLSTDSKGNVRKIK